MKKIANVRLVLALAIGFLCSCGAAEVDACVSGGLMLYGEATCEVDAETTLNQPTGGVGEAVKTPGWVADISESAGFNPFSDSSLADSTSYTNSTPVYCTDEVDTFETKAGRLIDGNVSSAYRNNPLDVGTVYVKVSISDTIESVSVKRAYERPGVPEGYDYTEDVRNMGLKPFGFKLYTEANGERTLIHTAEEGLSDVYVELQEPVEGAEWLILELEANGVDTFQVYDIDINRDPDACWYPLCN